MREIVKVKNSRINLEEAASIIKEAQTFVLSTHREPDGDGLGAELAILSALRDLGKKVRIINLDPTPARYKFLENSDQIENTRDRNIELEKTDLALIFDTNDPVHVGSIFDTFENKCKKIIFVDHHMTKDKNYSDKISFVIDKDAASSGEVTFNLLRKMNVELNPQVARALYAAVCFDTQVFKYIRGSSQSHKVAVELLKHERNPEQVHREIFGNYSVGKMNFLANTINNLEYLHDNKIGIIHISSKSMLEHKLSIDDTGDIIDTIMKVDVLRALALFREDAPNHYKLSLRSRGKVNVFKIAKDLGGGGHLNSSGAVVNDNILELKDKVCKKLISAISEAEG